MSTTLPDKGWRRILEQLTNEKDPEKRLQLYIQLGDAMPSVNGESDEEQKIRKPRAEGNR
jgi:sulfur transfer protein SufE